MVSKHKRPIIDPKLLPYSLQTGPATPSTLKRALLWVPGGV